MQTICRDEDIVAVDFCLETSSQKFRIEIRGHRTSMSLS